MTVARLRPTVAEIDLAAITANVAALRQIAGVELCAVVKADAYGHGAVEVAATVLDAGATCLAVAVVDEAIELRDAGLGAPILVLSEPPDDASLVAAIRSDAAITVGSAALLERVAVMARQAGSVATVEVKVDTGMHRAGVSPENAAALVAAAASSDAVRLGGVWTHLAVADEPDRSETSIQLRRFDAVLDALGTVGVRPPRRHAANSAGALAHPRARYDLIRCGIAMYGVAPSPAVAGLAALRPAMSLRSVVARAEVVPPGEGVSYGLRNAVAHERIVATVPVGYADGIDRGLGFGVGEVLIGGRRRRIVGAVTMDHLLVDCGNDAPAVGDEVTLLGRQGDEEITAVDWARWLDTIPYEMVTRISSRVARVYRRA